MSSNPKIVVVKMREIIYTLLLLFLVVLLVVCLVLMFAPKSDSDKEGQVAQNQQGQSEQTDFAQTGSSQTGSSQTDPSKTPSESSSSSARYTAGIYTTPVSLGDSTVDVEVTVDTSHINSIRLVNLSEAAAASFPLVSPSLDHISSQILASQSLEGVTCPAENKYTSQLLLSAISDAVARAQLPQQ